MAAGTIICTAEVSVASDGAPLCSGTWQLVPVPIPFDVSQVDPAVFGQYLGFGFGVVLSLWATSRCVKAVLDVILLQFRKG